MTVSMRESWSIKKRALCRACLVRLRTDNELVKLVCGQCNSNVAQKMQHKITNPKYYVSSQCSELFSQHEKEIEKFNMENKAENNEKQIIIFLFTLPYYILNFFSYVNFVRMFLKLVFLTPPFLLFFN